MSIGGDEYERERTGEMNPSMGRGGSTRRGTRTRLPGEDGDGGGRRPPNRPGRNLVTVLGVVVLLIAAIAFANRGGGGSDSGGDSEQAGDKKGQEAQPTAPTGEKPVDGEDATTGIPSGFAQSEQGAESAAANYTVVLGGTGMYSNDVRASIVDAVYTSDAAADREDDLAQVYGDEKFLKRIGLEEDGTAPEGMSFVSRMIPVGTKTLDYSSSGATVSVWYSSLFGLTGEESKNPVTESWYTNTFTLEWDDGDWKVADFEQKEGPAPVGRDQRAAPGKKMKEAVEGFGGFTYAR
ncbi:hypothetical protein [Streptomyces oceani]|uniref:DUF8175 domain-containing protein n=1 Tax=Streptomyces oceani TaxID=1075402 RepID=A0A1E7KQ57_9ACTN|nr:hypothetical protein [Streptomyces oceani]OEV06047.1 hypothetical protein AN216_00825 [Streptomyces oceani]